jgi:hypothetical protein
MEMNYGMPFIISTLIENELQIAQAFKNKK